MSEYEPKTGIQIKNCRIWFSPSNNSGVIDVASQNTCTGWIYYEHTDSFAYDYPEIVPKYVKKAMHRIRKEWITNA
jgi:hypothetical protein